jgi:hypothetical protein
MSVIMIVSTFGARLGSGKACPPLLATQLRICRSKYRAEV